jgi:hypothetical protein
MRLIIFAFSGKNTTVKVDGSEQQTLPGAR